MNTCPDCGKKFAKWPWKDQQGKIIWKNLFKIELEWAMIIIAMLIIAFTLPPMLGDCPSIMHDPCGYAKAKGCEGYYTSQTEADYTLVVDKFLNDTS